MIPLFPLLATPAVTVARDAGLSWSFDGTVRKAAGRYDLVGKDLRGEIAWFVASKGHFDAETLYASDTRRTKEADAAKGFRHTRKDDLLAGTLAIRSDQNYLWNGAAVASRCLYGAKGSRAWIVRLWWPATPPLANAAGLKAADAFLATVKPLSP